MIRNNTGDGNIINNNNNNNTSLEFNRRMLKFIGLIGTLSYVIPDLMLLIFVCYNAIFYHDRVVVVRSDYGLSLGVVFGLRYYMIPLFMVVLQIAIDFSLLIGIIINKKSFLIPALVYHGFRCILSVSAIVEFEQYVPEMQPYIAETPENNIDVDTVRMLLLCFAAIEIFSWLCIFLFFCQLTGVGFILRGSRYVHN